MMDIPPSWFVEALSKCATKIYEYAGRRGITEVRVDSTLGLSLGLTPGASMQVHTAAGYITVRAELPPEPLPPWA